MLLAYLTNNRAGHISALPSTVITPDLRDYASSEYQRLDAKLTTCEKALEISQFLAILDSLEERLAARRVQVELLEAERALGDDASRLLEVEIRTAQEGVWKYESWVETYSELVLEKGNRLGLIFRTS